MAWFYSYYEWLTSLEKIMYLDCWFPKFKTSNLPWYLSNFIIYCISSFSSNFPYSPPPLLTFNLTLLFCKVQKTSKEKLLCPLCHQIYKPICACFHHFCLFFSLAGKTPLKARPSNCLQPLSLLPSPRRSVLFFLLDQRSSNLRKHLSHQEAC